MLTFKTHTGGVVCIDEHCCVQCNEDAVWLFKSHFVFILLFCTMAEVTWLKGDPEWRIILVPSDRNGIQNRLTFFVLVDSFYDLVYYKTDMYKLRKHGCEHCHFASGCLWHHEKGLHTWQKCRLHHEPAFCSSIWLCSEKLSKTYFCCINVDGVSLRIKPEYGNIAYSLHSLANLHLHLDFPFRLRETGDWAYPVGPWLGNLANYPVGTNAYWHKHVLVFWDGSLDGV